MAENTKIVNKLKMPDVFQLYLEMGIERSLKKLFNKYPSIMPPYTTMRFWIRKYDWVAKADVYDRKEHDVRMRLALKGAMKSKTDILKICQSVLTSFTKELKGEKIVIERTDKKGIKTKQITFKRYHPDMGDAEKAYGIIKQELGEGLPDWRNAKELNLTQIFQQIINNNNDQPKTVDDGKSK